MQKGIFCSKLQAHHYLTPRAQDYTVGFKFNHILSEPQGPGTSKLDWRYLEHNKIDSNELQIHTNSQKATGTKIVEKLNKFEEFERKKVKFQACSYPRDLLITGQMPQTT